MFIRYRKTDIIFEFDFKIYLMTGRQAGRQAGRQEGRQAGR
jgi:predicted transposase YdaD